jgi:hypothetical protein
MIELNSKKLIEALIAGTHQIVDSKADVLAPRRIDRVRFRLDGMGDEEVDKLLKREISFNKFMEEHPFFIKKDYSVEDRVRCGDVIALYYLVVAGELDRIYERNIANDPKLGKEDPIKVKQDIAIKFIETTRQRNGEIAKSQKDSPITMGVEVEFMMPQRVMLNRIDKIVYQLLNYDIDIDLNLNSIDDVEPEVALLIETAKSYADMAKIDDPTLRKLENIRLMRDNLWGIRSLVMHTFGLLDDEVEMGDHEIKTSPSFSWKQQIRELLHLYKLHGLGKNWNFHVTLAGIELSEKHTESMDVLLMAAAAGYTPNWKVDQKIVEEIEQAEETDDEPRTLFHPESMMEFVRKTSPGFLLFPYHMVRDEDKMINYPVTRRMSQKGLELRGFGDYSLELADDEGNLVSEFPLIVRHMRFTYLAMNAIHAFQKPEADRNEAEMRMVKAWEELRSKWLFELEEAGIQAPKPEDYLTNSRFSSGKYDDILYDSALEAGFSRMFQDRPFQNNMRTHIRRFSVTMKQCINDL